MYNIVITRGDRNNYTQAQSLEIDKRSFVRHTTKQVPRAHNYEIELHASLSFNEFIRILSFVWRNKFNFNNVFFRILVSILMKKCCFSHEKKNVLQIKIRYFKNKSWSKGKYLFDRNMEHYKIVQKLLVRLKKCLVFNKHKS